MATIMLKTLWFFLQKNIAKTNVENVGRINHTASSLVVLANPKNRPAPNIQGHNLYSRVLERINAPIKNTIQYSERAPKRIVLRSRMSRLTTGRGTKHKTAVKMTHQGRCPKGRNAIKNTNGSGANNVQVRITGHINVP